MNITQRVKFSLTATKLFAKFIIKIWKSTKKHDRAVKELSKYLKKRKKGKHPLLRHYKEEPSAMKKIADDIEKELKEEK